jgi:hypothetical protein
MDIIMLDKIDYSYLRKHFTMEDNNHKDSNFQISTMLEKYYKQTLFENNNNYNTLFKNISNLNIAKIENKVDNFCNDILKDIREMNFDVLIC